MTIQAENQQENPEVGLFQNSGIYDNYDKKDSDDNFDDILKSLQTEQLNSLNNAISDLRLLIVERESLNSDLFKDIDKIKTDINNFILEAGPDVPAKDKLEMRKKMIEIEEIKLQEKLNSWRDVALLKRELRERQKEQEENVNRLDVLDKILEE